MEVVVELAVVLDSASVEVEAVSEVDVGVEVAVSTTAGVDEARAVLDGEGCVTSKIVEEAVVSEDVAVDAGEDAAIPRSGEDDADMDSREVG